MLPHLIFLLLIVVILGVKVKITIERQQGKGAGPFAGRPSPMSSRGRLPGHALPCQNRRHSGGDEQWHRTQSACST